MKSTRTIWVALLFVCLVGFTTACQRHDENNVQAAKENGKVMTPQDADVAMKIEQSHLGEIDLARLAKQKAADGGVKSYADMIEDDHTGAVKGLQKIMNKSGVNESTHSKPVEATDKMAAMQNMAGADFDREFMNTMVMDHQKTLDDLRSAVTAVQNADLKDYINDLIPKVQKHLEKGQDLVTKLTTGK